MWRTRKSHAFYFLCLLEAVLELPRLCVYHDDPSQYYPCVLNYIGLTSWSLYRCPNQATFDEESQQCLVKVPISDTFEQLTTFPSVEHAQFRRLASFIVATPVPNEDPDVTQQQLRRLVSLPPMADKLIESLASRKLNKVRAESTKRNDTVRLDSSLEIGTGDDGAVGRHSLVPRVSTDEIEQQTSGATETSDQCQIKPFFRTVGTSTSG